jgi:transposase-like protein
MRMALTKKDPSEMNGRETRALAMLQDGSRPITKTARNVWMVPSQTKPALAYLVTRYAGRQFSGATRWTCTCPDYENRGQTCKHQYAVQFLLAVPLAQLPSAPVPAATAQAAANPVAEPIPSAFACPHCAGSRVIKQGFKCGKQRFRCKACRRNFVPANGFDRIAADPQAVCLALDLSFKGLSLRKVTDTLSQFYSVEVGKSTIHRWMTRYAKLLDTYVDTLGPQVGDKWHADEVFTKFGGRLQYVWHLMDAKTRYLLVSQVTPARETKDARAVFRKARRLAGKVPTEVVTDGLPAYADAFHASFDKPENGPLVKHTREIHISKPEAYAHNNKVERLNGTLRERQKVTRGLKNPNGPLTKGHRAYYNLIRPHQGLNGKTPAEAAGLRVLQPGNRWHTHIAAAAEHDRSANLSSG